MEKVANQAEKEEITYNKAQVMNERPMAGMVENGSNCESEDHGVKRVNYYVSTGEIIWIISRRNKNEKNV